MHRIDAIAAMRDRIEALNDGRVFNSAREESEPEPPGFSGALAARAREGLDLGLLDPELLDLGLGLERLGGDGPWPPWDPWPMPADP
jgi:hypothetical protein